MKYIFKWKRRLWSKKETVVGHKLFAEHDRMDLYLPNGGIISIPKWSECTLWLGQDWVLAQKKAMENETGKDIKLNVEDQ